MSSLSAAHASVLETVVMESLPDSHTLVFGPLNIVERVHNIVNLVAVKVGELIPDMDADTIEATIGFTISMYDKYVVQLDIPGIPNVIEPMFDEAMRRLIRVLLTAILTK